MELQEFKKSINRVEYYLNTNKKGTFKYNGLCVVIYWVFSSGLVRDTFIELFRPKYKSLHPYWIGALNEENYGIRKMVLREFEVICINDKLYLEF